MKVRRALLLILAAAMLTVSSGVVYADDATDADAELDAERQTTVNGKVVNFAEGTIANDSEDLAKTNNSSTAVNIDVEVNRLTIGDGNMVSLNVPSIIPVLFTSDGKTYTPTNWGITNNDTKNNIIISNISLVGNEVDGKTWTVSNDVHIPTSVDTTALNITIREDKAEEAKSYNFADLRQYSRAPFVLEKVTEVGKGNKQRYFFDIIRPTYTKSMDISGAYTLNLDFKME